MGAQEPENLDFEQNLGRSLIQRGEIKEARKVLRRNADAREERFGIDSVEYAIGLEGLAEAQFADGALDLALDTVGEAIGIFFKTQQLRIGASIALEAEIAISKQSAQRAERAESGARASPERDPLTARNQVLPPYAELGDIPDDVVEAIAAASIDRCNRTTPERALIMMERLRGFLLERLGESHGATIRVLAGLANTHRELGHHRERREALDALAASFECLGAVAEVVETLLARALAEVEGGESDAAVATHREALARAKEVREPRLEAKVLRFLGYLQIDRGEIDAARESFESALSKAKSAKDQDQEARAQAGLGLALMYAGQMPESRPCFDAALILLPHEDPEVEWVEALAGAIDRGETRARPVSELIDAHARVRRAG